MSSFEPTRLLAYDRTSLIAELRRVAALVPGQYLTQTAFNRLARVHSTTVRTAFGGWPQALTAAGLSGRFCDRTARRTPEAVISELQRVAALLHTEKLGREEFERHSQFKQKAVGNAFGSWKAALAAAGLSQRAIREPTDEEFFENLLTVWTHYGRAPRYAEMKRPPSHISGKAYARRWLGWTKAVYAFVAYAEASGGVGATQTAPAVSRPVPRQPTAAANPQRTPSVGLRYIVLRRDRFRCVLCGNSPAKDLTCELHVDHVVPFVDGGLTTLENLRTLCLPCNLGKGRRLDNAG